MIDSSQMAEPAKDKVFGNPAEGHVSSFSTSEIARLRDELDSLKLSSPLRIAELAIELQIAQIRVKEITSARDLALHRLSEAYLSIVQKNETIEQMQKEIEAQGGSTEHISHSAHLLAEIERLKVHIATLEAMNDGLTLEPGQPRDAKHNDPPPCYEVNVNKMGSHHAAVQTDSERDPVRDKEANRVANPFQYTPPLTDCPTELFNARNMFLGSIPLPDNPPDATLTAIVIPPPHTLHELLSSLPANTKESLSDYKTLPNATTFWCPDREEHGVIYIPMFKCTTNPRIATAHQWSANPELKSLNLAKPMQCFFDKDGIWYYAGLYKAFLMDNVSPKEWEQLAPETMARIVKDTLSGRKNSSPQSTYETTQLYAAGALKVKCVGLQCIGFSQEIYNTVLEHSVLFNDGRWKTLGALDINAAGAPIHLSHRSSTTTPNSGTNTPTTAHCTPGHGGTWPAKTPVCPVQSGKPEVANYPNLLTMRNGSSLSHHHVQVHVSGLPSMGLGLSGSTWSHGPSANGKVLQQAVNPHHAGTDTKRNGEERDEKENKIQSNVVVTKN